MASRGEKVMEGQAMNRWIYETVIRDENPDPTESEKYSIARQMNVDELPMSQDPFNFYGYTVGVLKKMGGFPYHDLYDFANDVLRMIFMSATEGTEGSIYNYKDQVEKGNVWFFDDHFKRNVKQKARTKLTEFQREKNRPKLSLDYATESEFEGEPMERGLREDPKALRAEEIFERKEFLEKEIPQFLLNSGNHGWKLEALWKEMQLTSNLRILAEALNEKGIPALKGGAWSESSVDNAKAMIVEKVKEHMGRMGIDVAASISGSRRGFRFGRYARRK